MPRDGAGPGREGGTDEIGPATYTPRGMTAEESSASVKDADEENGEAEPATGGTDANGSDGDGDESSKKAPARPAGNDGERHRRLHALSGALALGAFLIVHLLTNASALGGHALYDSVVGSLARSSVVTFIEVVFILLPLGFHAGYGIVLLAKNATADAEIERRYGDRRFFVLQRVSAVLVLVFVLAHVWELRLQRLFFGLPADGLYTTLTAHLSSTWAGVPFVALLYILGIFAATVHLANGLFAASAMWNLGLSPAGRRKIRLVTAALGLLLFLVGTATVIGLATGTRLLSGAAGDSAPPQAPCGSAVPPPFQLAPATSR